MATEPQDQLGMDEQVLEDEELENALKRRQVMKEQLGDYRKDYKSINDRVRLLLERYEFPDDGGALRVGAFRITATEIKARSVSFETDSRTQISIAKVGDE